MICTRLLPPWMTYAPFPQSVNDSLALERFSAPEGPALVRIQRGFTKRLHWLSESRATAVPRLLQLGADVEKRQSRHFITVGRQALIIRLTCSTDRWLSSHSLTAGRQRYSSLVLPHAKMHLQQRGSRIALLAIDIIPS